MRNLEEKIKNKLNKNLSSSSRNLYYKKYSKKNFIEKIKKDRNDLQSIVEKKYPKISKLIQDISIQKGCIFSRMTGSGSACASAQSWRCTSLRWRRRRRTGSPSSS